MAYSSDLTDAEWEIFEPLLQKILPTKKKTRPSNRRKRDIFNGILQDLCGATFMDLQKIKCPDFHRFHSGKTLTSPWVYPKYI
ncbi:transposase [Nostoc sp.]|uniref:transposase n=1 Tax=Nostoc sp. TaxID=1180 RepID=UPI002FFC8BAC